MFKDKRQGWLKKLKENQIVTIRKDQEEFVGRIKKITPVGVFLIEINNSLKIKIEPNGKDLTGRIELLQKRGK